MAKGRRLAIAAAASAGFCVLFVVWMTVDLGGTRTTTWFDDLSELAAAFVAVACCALAAVRSTGGWGRRGWTLMGLSALSWGVGQAVWSWYELLQGREAPFPSPADAGFLLAVPPAVLAVLALSGGGSPQPRLRSVLDGLIIGCAFLSVSWGTALGAVYHAGGVGALATGLGLTYPISDVVIMSMLTALALRISTGARVATLLLVGGLTALAVADSTFAYLTATSSFGAGNAVDVGWVAGYLMIGLAALRSAGAPLVISTRRPAPGLARDILPYLPILPAAAVWIRGEFTGSEGPFLYMTMLALVALVVIRQLLVFRQNNDLIRQLAARERLLEFRAHHDQLTGLVNRELLRTRAALELDRHGRDGGDPPAVLCLDLDGLAMITRTLGHEAGDRMLVVAARRLAACVGPEDMVARIGGDTLAVLIPRAETGCQLDRLTERILDSLAEPAMLGDELVVRSGATVGIAVAEPLGLSADELLRRADVALHTARATGPGLVGRIDQSLQVTLSRRSEGPDDERRLVAAPGLCGEDRVRRWLARELHDDAVQTMTGLLVDMEELRRGVSDASLRDRLLSFQGAVRSTLGSLRTLLRDLREQGCDDGRLIDDVSALLEHLDRRTGIRGELTVSPSWPSTLSAQMTSNLRRIVEEALRNVALHSRAQRVVVSLDTEDERLTLTVSDDGHGYDLPETVSPAGTGMLGMHERAVILGGRLDVTSLPGRGTTVRGTFSSRSA